MNNILRLALAFGALVAEAFAAQPNILFIMTDQHSADALSCRIGDRYLKTPNLDRLAARGTFFTRAYTPNPLCMPARNSIFTGRYPHETKITDNTKVMLDANAFPTMGAYFRRAGYQTAYFGKWHLAYPEGQTATHGFETLDTGHLDAENAAHAATFLAQKHAKPFLLVVSFLNPHNVCGGADGVRPFDVCTGLVETELRPSNGLTLSVLSRAPGNPPRDARTSSPMGSRKSRSARRHDARRRREAAGVRNSHDAEERRDDGERAEKEKEVVSMCAAAMKPVAG